MNNILKICTIFLSTDQYTGIINTHNTIHCDDKTIRLINRRVINQHFDFIHPIIFSPFSTIHTQISTLVQPLWSFTFNRFRSCHSFHYIYRSAYGIIHGNQNSQWKCIWVLFLEVIDYRSHGSDGHIGLFNVCVREFGIFRKLTLERTKSVIGADRLISLTHV